MKKIILLFAVVIFLCFSSRINYAQSPNWSWARSYGGSLRDGVSGIACYPGGNIYVTGIFDSPSITIGSYTLYNSGSNNNDIYIAKYDSLGNVLWAKQAGSIYVDYTTGITVDHSGNVYITGTFFGDQITFGSLTLSNSHTGYAESFIVKYNASGNVLWAKKTGSNSDEVYSQCISIDDNGNIFINGSFSGTNIVFGSYTLINACPFSFDIFVAKYNTSGNVIWAKSAGGLDDDGLYFSGIANDGDGNAFITGNFRSVSALFNGITVLNSDPDGMNTDIFIAKYNANGNLLWVKSAGSANDEEYSYSVATDLNENAYITGSSGNNLIFENDTLNSPGFLAKFNPSGNELWAISSGAYNVVTDGGGNVYITGGFSSSSLIFGNDTLINAGTYSDIFIVKYDSSANVLWAKSAGGINDDVGVGISFDDGGIIYMAGSFNSPSINFGSTTLISNGMYDNFVAKLGGTGTSVSFIDPSSRQLKVFPNPATNKIEIETLQNSDIEILNIKGQLIKSISAKENQTTIDISDFAKGMYFVKVKNNNGVAVKKFIKE